MYSVILISTAIVLGIAILLPWLARVMDERHAPVGNGEAIPVMNSVESRPKQVALQLILFLVMIITLSLAIAVRLIGGGWYLIVFGIPLLLIAILHFGFQITAIRRVLKMEPDYILLILLSNLFLFLGFALQIDIGDGPGSYVAIYVFFATFFGHGDSKVIPAGQSSIYGYASVGFLIALVISWFFLLGKTFVKKENLKGADTP